TLFFDYTPNTGISWIDRFGFDGVTGAGISSDQHRSGFDSSIGDQYFFQTKIRYKVFPWLSPFFAFHYTATRPGDTTNRTASAAISPISGANVGAGSTAYVPGSHEVLTGGGLEFHITPVATVNTWFIRGIDGQNTTRTNALYMNFVYVWF
ncbi:MAG: hypothetical protein KGJ55_12765, partial [Gammaproteobacteria bacterium]|nr:hypothetical protein [Gammaproteobacteria bacterium]